MTLNNHTFTFHCALLCISCDNPAARKVSGFLGHASKHACPRCKQEFQFDSSIGKMNYSSFTSCDPRSQSEHKIHSAEWIHAKTSAERERIEKLHGYRFSVLLYLPYIDLIRFTVVDPMHNLFLGTAKHFLSHILLGNDLLSRAQTLAIQNTVDACIVPSSTGRIPHKIASNFSSFTADQWKNWVLMFSLPSVYNVLPQADFECWRKFVVACFNLCSPIVSIAEINMAHNCLIQFCESCVSIYGQSAATINMHLHTHLKDCIIDFGPIYSFWLFSFERYNGLLGSYHTNQRSIEIQVMRRFLEDSEIKHMIYSDLSAVDEHQHLFRSLLNKRPGGTATDTLFPSMSDYVCEYAEFDIVTLINLPSQIPLQPSMSYLLKQNVSFLPPFYRYSFDKDSLRYLSQSYSTFLPDLEPSDVPNLYDSYSTVTIWGDRIGSEKSKLERCKYVMANWVGTDGNIAKTTNELALEL